MTDPYAWWHAALAMVGPSGKLSREQQTVLGVHEGDPQPGFYRRYPSKYETNHAVLPVAIWRDADGIMRAKLGDADVDPDSIWTYACKAPITYEQWREDHERSDATD